MKRYTQAEFDAAQVLHNKWLAGEIGGVRADFQNADLSYLSLDHASLDYARLDRARLDGASLDHASLVGASLDGASLDGASLDYARLDGARLDHANLDHASLVGARLDGVTIKSCVVFAGLYKYITVPIIAEDGTEWVKLGRYLRTVADWNADFWNNNSEFPNIVDIGSQDRWNAYQAALAWLRTHREVK